MDGMELTIILNGKIQESNFDAFKDHYLAEIKKADKKLVTDDDFADAVERVARAKSLSAIQSEMALKFCKICKGAIIPPELEIIPE